MQRNLALQRLVRHLTTLMLVFGALLLVGQVSDLAVDDCCPELSAPEDEDDCCESDFGRCCVSAHITVPSLQPAPLAARSVEVDLPSPPPAPRLVARHTGPPPTPPPIGLLAER